MSRYQGRKTCLEPTGVQSQALSQHAGAARWAYNWGLRIRDQAYSYGQRENTISLHKLLNSLKESQYSWLYEVSKSAPQEALRDLDTAYENFFRRVKDGKKGKAVGYPKYKKRGANQEKFRVTGAIRVTRDQGSTYSRAFIQLPRVGKIRLSENDYLPEGDYSQATVKFQAGAWYVSVLVPASAKLKYGQGKRNPDPIGVDLGLRSLLVISDGKTITGANHLRANLRKLRKLEKEKSRRQQGSNNRLRTVRRLQRLHARVSNQRKDYLHKITTALVNENTKIVIEDLQVQNMLKNHKLALSLSDAGFSEFRRLLEYKSNLYGVGLQIAPRYYPSTQTCSNCKNVKTGSNKLTLKDREYECAECGLIIDRDLNAARNLASLHDTAQARILVREPEHSSNSISKNHKQDQGLLNPALAGSCPERLNACGAESADSLNKERMKLSAMKQEARIIPKISTSN